MGNLGARPEFRALPLGSTVRSAHLLGAQRSGGLVPSGRLPAAVEAPSLLVEWIGHLWGPGSPECWGAGP